ncbi:DNA primase [Pseudomarimonas salicorniae]|uniref:DNA primase n=1 Tax=Pseudomarimonas salicorniae TaxID=2933270 RepID=A0ABT0GE01_9GAMM|nr:DNA primase [Lysobacter sp. CAU 1642]MCK7592577.1 DNA primase [Lysobacter sp. CAU 1642]
MARIPDAFIDDLLARTDIVDVIQARVPLKKAGREYQARCPFHDERSPSFTVSPTKQFYHCFGCGAHGSAIKFLMEYDRLEFLDAVEELAKRAGVEVPRETHQRHQRSDFQPLYDVCERAARFFSGQLVESPRARQYLQRRGVDAETQQRFGIGYAPDGWEALKSALGSDGRELALLDKAGLLSRNDSGRVYDKFRDRVMFPIHDRRGRVIAFGGRVLEKDDGPKYLNSPETPLFHKGRELYGLWQVRQAHNRIPRLIVVEGYMDVVALFQYGITTAVATLGTATTPDHAELLFRNAGDIYFCFDGDRAGRSAAWKALESVLPRMRDGRQAFFLFLPDGEDPDSLLRADGAEGFQRQLEQAVPLSEFLFGEVSREINLSTLDGKARLAERCRPLLAQIPDGAFRDLMQQKLANQTGLAARITAPASMEQSVQRRPGPSGARRSLVRSVIALLLHQPRLAREAAPPWGFAGLRQPGIGLLLELLELCRESGAPNAAVLLEHFAGREEEPALRKLALVDFPGEEAAWKQEFLDGLQQLARQARTQRLADLRQQQQASGLTEEEKNELRALLRESAEPTQQA